jgi:hypothetical protein
MRARNNPTPWLLCTRLVSGSGDTVAVKQPEG